MKNLRVLTLKSEDLPLSAETGCTAAYSTQVSTVSYEEQKAETYS